MVVVVVVVVVVIVVVVTETELASCLTDRPEEEVCCDCAVVAGGEVDSGLRKLDEIKGAKLRWGNYCTKNLL